MTSIEAIYATFVFMRSNQRRSTELPPIRRWLLMGLIVLQTVALVALLLTARGNSSTVQVNNAESMMAQVSTTVFERIQNFLAPAEKAVRVLYGLITRGTIIPNTTALEDFLLEQLSSQPQLTGMYFGGTDGSFIFARREKKGLSLKRIAVVNGRRQVTLRLYNNVALLLSTQSSQDDGFDPRSRPWYKAAISRQNLIWTSPYVFFSSQRPGVTTAIPVKNSQSQIIGVVGADIEISALSEFIGQMPISKNGQAFIVDVSGAVVALPRFTLQSGSRELPKLQEVGSEPAQLLEQNANASELLEYRIGNTDWIGSLRPLSVNQDNTWSLGIYMPRQDFVEQSEAIFNRQLWQTMAICIFVVLLAVPLVWQFSIPVEGWYTRATTDELTGLLNRKEFLSRAAKLLAQGHTSAVLVRLDVDKLQMINHIFGREAGDKALKIVANGFEQRIRKTDLTARIGEDDFVLLLPNIDHGIALQKLEQWCGEITEPFKQMLSLSAGVTQISNPSEVEAKLQEAEIALLVSKKRGGNTIKSYLG